MALVVIRSGSEFIVGGNSAVRAWHEIRSNAAVNLQKKRRKKCSKSYGAESSGFPIQTPSVKHLGTVPNVWVIMFGSHLPSGLFPWGEYSLGEKRNGRKKEDKLPFSPMIYIWSEYPCSIFFYLECILDMLFQYETISWALKGMSPETRNSLPVG